MNTLLDALETGKGYYLGLSLNESELNLIRSLVQSQWIENIKYYAPSHWKKFNELGIANYHKLAHLLEHSLIWPLKNRIFSQDAVDVIRSTVFVKHLEDIYGQFEFADVEGIGREEIYWRLVRPNESSDVGPLHADQWFWELGHGVMKPNVDRIKVWVALYCEPGLNGLRVVPDSQKKEWRYHGEYRDGFLKPQIDEDEAKLNIQLANTKPGDAIIFHDRLLHGGALNTGQQTRVNIKFTMFVKNK